MGIAEEIKVNGEGRKKKRLGENSIGERGQLIDKVRDLVHRTNTSKTLPLSHGWVWGKRNDLLATDASDNHKVSAVFLRTLTGGNDNATRQ